jgi:hypothetical protein
MSDESPEWFAPKRYGYGAGMPISWQGWALTAVYLIGVMLVAVFIGKSRPIVFFALLIPMTVAFATIAAKTTRGGWPWRWGADD